MPRGFSIAGIHIPASNWILPDPSIAERESDLVGIGAELDPITVLNAYATGLFPMHVDIGNPTLDLGWWSPNPRGILRSHDLRVTKSLTRSIKKFSVSFDRAFARVITECIRPAGEGNWITPEFIETYTVLHQQGFAHSVEVWNSKGELAGGLYGIELGGLFAGESMFHRETDASKVALVGLVNKLGSCPGDRLLDVQWKTDHLATLGVTEISRRQYLDELSVALNTQPCFAT